MLEDSNYEQLLLFDQLRIQRLDVKAVFIGFDEGKINHMPTYKYDTGTDNWDSSEKNRPPAWTDRILWKGGPTKQLSYRSHPKLKISDHKPVSGLFEASIKVVNQTKYRKIYEDVMKKLDKLENEFLPQVAVDKTEVIFNPLSFRQPLIEYLTIANTGQVPVRYQFKEKPGHTTFCKEWLTINPFTETISPGDTLEVELKITVDKATAPSLNAKFDSITDILVLHLEHGRDLFITITGTYLPSCYGSSIESLCRTKKPVRKMEAKVYQETLKLDSKAEKCWDVPKEIWLLTDHLFKYGMTQEDLFQQSGLHTEFLAIRDALDIGWPEKVSESTHSIAEALLLLIEAFSEPVIPYTMYQRALDCSSSFTECKKVCI